MFPVPAFNLRPSRLLIYWVGAMHALVALVPLWLPWPGPLRLILLLIVAADAWFSLRRYRQVYGLVALRVTNDHQLQVQTKQQNEWQSVALLSPCYLLPFVAILKVRRAEASRSEHWLLLPGMMEREAWRRLRVWMKWRLPELLPSPFSLRKKLKQMFFGMR